MWHTWLHEMGSSRPADKPRCWWRQLEQRPRHGMPFAHLFPRPPTHRAPPPSEAERLVRELAPVAPAEPTLEEIVQRHRSGPPIRSWEPVEAWQIVSVERLDERESARWGEGGDQVVEWFDRGDLESWARDAALAALGERRNFATRPTGWRAGIAKLRRWCRPRQVAWAGADF